MKMVPDFPMRGLSRSPITSPVTKHHLQIALRAGCPAPTAAAKRSGPGAVGERRSQFGEALRADAEGLGKTDAVNLTS
jgi:hypothetical protein